MTGFFDDEQPVGRLTDVEPTAGLAEQPGNAIHVRRDIHITEPIAQAPEADGGPARVQGPLHGFSVIGIAVPDCAEVIDIGPLFRGIG